MISTTELKRKALFSLKGKWANGIVIILLFSALTMAVSTVSVIISLVFSFILSIPLIISAIQNSSTVIDAASSSYSFIIQSIYTISIFVLNMLVFPLSLGLIIYFLNFAKNKEPKISEIFDGYKKSFGNSILATLLITIYTLLWSLLLVVPGIIKAYSYSMTFFIMVENPKISANDAITKSRELMDGHKWEYFVLQLSFIGWAFLASFTCGIGYLWLAPYMQITMSNFYLSIKEEHEDNKSENEVVLEQF